MKKRLPKVTRKKLKTTYLHGATRLEGVVKNRGIRNIRKKKKG